MDRSDLVRRLEQESRHPIVVVRAPAGGGKSTLVASWAGRHPRTGVWVGMDRSSGSRLVFWQRVVDSIVGAGLVPPGSLLTTFVVTVDITDQLRTILRRGLDDAGGVTIILDDFHEAQDESIAEDLLWLAESGAAVSFVVVTRQRSALEDAVRRARVDIGLILATELSFDRDEVFAAGELFGAGDAVEEIHRAFSGWPLPTRAALIQLQSDGITAAEAIERVRADGDGFVVDLASAGGFGNFLLRTSVASRIGRALALEIGGPDADSHLARAERDGLGTWSSTASREEFAVHPYLRERLEAEFERRHPDDVATVRRAYAAERVAMGDPVEAARQLVAIGDLDALVDVIRGFHGEILRSRAYGSTLQGVDENRLRKYPELLAARMIVEYASPSGRRPGLVQLANLTASIIYARLGGGEPVERVSLLVSLLTAQRVGGHYDQAAKTAERLVTALDHLDDAGAVALRGIIPSAWTHVATSFLYEDQPERAASALDQAIDASTRWAAPWTLLHARSLRELVFAMRGDMVALEPDLKLERQRQGPAGWRGTYTAAGYHFAEAYAALEHFDVATARANIDALAAHEAGIEHWPLIAALRGLASLVEGTPYIGLQQLASNVAAHEDRPPTSRPMLALLTTTRADLLLFDGQPHRALELLKSSRRDPGATLARARAHLVLGDNAEAVKLAAPIAWADAALPRAKAKSLLLIAVASARLGQHSEARDSARRAVDVLDSFGLRRPLMMVPRSDLVEVLEAAGIPSTERLAGVPDRFTTTARDWSLTATELRVLALLERTGRTDELSATLGVSANTVKSHLRQIYRKLDARSRAEALAVAGMHGLLDRQNPRDSA